jgi:hypothetical protein
VENLYTYKNTYMDIRRRPIFHYLLFANSQLSTGLAGSSGLAEINGNDVLITLGGWGLTTTPAANLNRLINYQAGTVMHELGHNLGLRHGGNENLNYKPNYVSTMNYLYQLSGLPTIGTSEGDRYYLEAAQYYSINCNGYSSSAQLTNPPSGLPANFSMDYSSGGGTNLVESNVNESAGLGRIGSGAVDFDCSGTTNNGYALNLNPQDTSTASPTETLSDNNDWAMVDLLFQRQYDGDTTGVSMNSPLRFDPMREERPPVAEETPPPPEFFRRLQEEIAGER